MFTCVIFVFTERGKYRCLNQIDKVINDYLYIELPCYTTLIHLHPHFIFHYAPTNHHMLMHMNKKTRPSSSHSIVQFIKIKLIFICNYLLDSTKKNVNNKPTVLTSFFSLSVDSNDALSYTSSE